jgi:hypothetical protein
MDRLTSRQLLFAVLPLASFAAIVAAILLPAASSNSVSAQHADGLSNKTRPPSRYIESKFELATADPSRDAAFYSKIGFRVVAKTSYGYLTLKSGPVVIALSPVTNSSLPDIASLSKVRRPPIGVEIVLYTAENLEEAHTRLKRLGLNPTDIRLQPWGVRDFRITDPGGYYIRISEGHAIPAN